MANIKIALLGTERSKTDETELECFASHWNEIFITIDGKEFICLDRSTAIKLVKILKTEINKLNKEDEDGI